MKIIFLKAHFILYIENIQDVRLQTHNKIAMKIEQMYMFTISKLSVLPTYSLLSINPEYAHCVSTITIFSIIDSGFHIP